LQCLGAKSIKVECVKGMNIEKLEETNAKLKGEIQGTVNKGKGGTQFDKKNKSILNSNKSILANQEFNPQKYPYVPEELIWYPHEPIWLGLAKQRIRGNILNTVISFSSNDIEMINSS